MLSQSATEWTNSQGWSAREAEMDLFHLRLQRACMARIVRCRRGALSGYRGMCVEACCSARAEAGTGNGSQVAENPKKVLRNNRRRFCLAPPWYHSVSLSKLIGQEIFRYTIAASITAVSISFDLPCEMHHNGSPISPHYLLVVGKARVYS
jgi:hypothetical protein